MSQWSVEQVLGLAPDASAIAAARELSSQSKWVFTGCDGTCVWGAAKGSGQNPYQTAIYIGEPAFKCSCPSRKFPCKHSLGLFIRYAQGQIAAGAAPDWVTEWVDKRSEKVTKALEKAQVPKGEADPAAAAKRAEKRWNNILAGLDECEGFLVDVAGQGLLSAQSARSWDQMAARLIDAQAPGVARRLRRIGSAIGVGADWSAEVVSAMGNLNLLIEAARRFDEFDHAKKADIVTALGIPTRKEDLNGEKVMDVWDVMGHFTETDDRVTTARTWLLGRTSNRWALNLAFSVAGQPFEGQLPSGSAFHAEVEYYPSASPLRVSVGPRAEYPFDQASGGDWEDAIDRLSQGLAVCPWLEQWPVVLADSTLAKSSGTWYSLDRHGASFKLRGPEPWGILAVSGNAPSHFFGEFDGKSLRLLSGWGRWGFIPA